MYRLRHLDKFANQLEAEMVIPREEIDFKWNYVAREICREQRIGSSEKELVRGISSLPKETELGPKSEAKFKYFQEWAKEQGSGVSFPI